MCSKEFELAAIYKKGLKMSPKSDKNNLLMWGCCGKVALNSPNRCGMKVCQPSEENFSVRINTSK